MSVEEALFEGYWVVKAAKRARKEEGSKGA